MIVRLIDADDIIYDSIDSEDTNRYAYYYGTGIMAARKEDIDAMPTIEQPEYKPITAEDFAKTMSENTIYDFVTWHIEALTLMNKMGFVICKKTM